MNIENEVFGDAGSEWNKHRERLERALLEAAEALLSHSDAAAVDIEADGVKVSVSLAAAERMDS